MSLLASLLIVLNFSFTALAQKSKLRCSTKAGAAKSCNLKSNDILSLTETSIVVKDLCEKEHLSDEFLEAYKYLTIYNAGSYYSSDDSNIINLKNEIMHLNKLLAQVGTKEYLEKMSYVKKINLAWTQADSLSLKGKENQAIAAEKKAEKLESEFYEKFGESADLSYEMKPNEIKAEISSLEQKIKSIEMKKAAISATMAKTDKTDLEQKKEVEKLNLKASIALEIEDIKTRKTFTDCGLNYQEIYAIMLYTDSHYGKINSALRSNNETEINKLKPIIDAINSGLSKIQSYTGFVKRGADLPEKIEKLHCLGCTVTYSAYTSSSTEAGFAASSMFMIKSKNGKYIAPLSNNASEEEVLFAPGTDFKILNIKKQNDVKIFTMSEK